MLSGTTYRGMFEERLTGVIREAEAAAEEEEGGRRRKVVLFVDEIHMLLGAGRTRDSTVDASNMLKPALARGRLRCLGATTHDEYQRYFAKDAAFERRFQKVVVPEPTEDATVDILRELKASYEEHHGMKIRQEALVAAVKLSGRYVTARHFPDKAIDLVDEACATARLQKDLRKQQGDNSGNVVGPDHIAQIVSKWTGIPVTRLGQDERNRLLDLPKMLQRRVVGQDEAVRAVADAVVRSRTGIGNPKQPSGSFLFLGPTGVGMTELAKALAEQLFGDEKMLVRIDMSEYVGSSSVARLIGAAPGTVGFEDGGQLTEAVRQRPYSVVLFDEVEKGDATVFNLFLQILEDGRLTDGHGRTVDFTNTIIIMTSNLGAHHLAAAAATTDGDDNDDARHHQLVLADVQRHFRPELVNRLDEMVVFRPLSGETLREVARLQLAAVAARLAGKGIGLDITDAALDALLSRAGDQVHVYGARPIRRCLHRDVMTRISQMMVRGEVDHGYDISVDAAAAAGDDDNDELVFTAVKRPGLEDESSSLESDAQHEVEDMPVDSNKMLKEDDDLVAPMVETQQPASGENQQASSPTENTAQEDKKKVTKKPVSNRSQASSRKNDGSSSHSFDPAWFGLKVASVLCVIALIIEYSD
ncbi:hypothetical protein EJB05_06171, partial [Eragrostis curvula]